jgi:hypothetical protein
MKTRPSAQNGTPSTPDLLAQALHAFTETTGLQGQLLSLAPRQHRAARTDAALCIADENRQWKFSIELRPRLMTASLGAVAAELRERKPRGILVTHHVSLPLAEQLRAANIPFLDTAGNAFLNEPRLFVFVSGKRPTQPRPTKGKLSQVFRPSGLGILFTLLCHPGMEAQPLRTIATAAGVSLAAVGWEMKQLEQAGYLLNLGARGRHLVKQPELLQRWVEAYQERWRPKLLLGRYSASQPDWWQGKEKQMQQLKACWGGEMAAAQLTRYLKPQTQTIYTESAAKDLQLAFGLKRDAHGPIEILKTFWSFADATPNRSLVPELLVYADLLASGDERNWETARIIYDQSLARLVGETAA